MTSWLSVKALLMLSLDDSAPQPITRLMEQNKRQF